MSPEHRLSLWCFVVLATVLAWEVVASWFLIWVFGYQETYPWPKQGIMWVYYFLEERADPIVARWLLLSALISGLAVLLLALVIVKLVQLAMRGPPTNKTVYGETGFADRDGMQRGGLRLRK